MGKNDDQVVHNFRGRGDRLTLTSSKNYIDSFSQN